MSNPFVNLRKFVPDLADPKENHATESLAACLKFSPVLKALTERPGRILAFLPSAIVSERQIEKISESDLVNILHKTIVTHCKIIDGLV